MQQMKLVALVQKSQGILKKSKSEWILIAYQREEKKSFCVKENAAQAEAIQMTSRIY